MEKNQKLFESGKFFVGVNYWASHAGMFMWRNWNSEIVEKDFKLLSENGIEVLRVFPLWPDFQPLRLHVSSSGSEYRFGEDPMPFTEAGACGVDEKMADRFEIMCDLAEKYNMKLVVGLITGWMSGRVFLPESLVGHNALTDPAVIRWEIRFVRYLVKRFKDHPAIGAWDLGNECNCLGSCSHDEAFLWASIITNTVRSEDRNHPVVSGMHGLKPEGAYPWSMSDQGEILDILCTHPYPMFTPYCNTDPLNTMKPVLHATAESIYFSSLGHKPCFIEEGGTLGPMISSDEVAADYMKASLFSSWAHDLRGFCWWCAFDQDELTNTPYDWDPVERELGMFTAHGAKKAVADEFSSFSRFIKSLPFDRLPERIKDATVILTSGQDQWGAAFGSFILAKQAGLDVDFTWCRDEVPDSRVYLMPSVCSNHAVSKRTMDKIMEKVYEGATLYISISNGVLTHFREITGLYLITRNENAQEGGEVRVRIGGEELKIYPPYRHVLESVGADIKAEDQNGNPFLAENVYGKGKVIFCNAPIEIIAATSRGTLTERGQIPYSLSHPLHKIYRELRLRNPEKKACCDNPSIGLTEHICDSSSRLLCILNHCPYEQTEEIILDGYRPGSCFSQEGSISAEPTEKGFRITLPANTGAVVTISKS
ncbi:MAG: beta-mannanase [Clostridia bacterium]|nr:beta-mannanase [Clostridia bacterium]